MKPSSNLGTSQIWHRHNLYIPYHQAIPVWQAPVVPGLLEGPDIHTKANRP